MHQINMIPFPSSFSDDQSFFHFCTLSIFILSLPTIFFLQFLQAPYGKHRRPGWGPTLSPPLAWFLMESPTLFLTLFIFPFGRHKSNPKSLFLITPFLVHYIHRTLIYPIRLNRLQTNPTTAGGFPITVAAMGFLFNSLNSYQQSRWVSHYAEYDTDGWFWWRFSGGLVVFLSGMTVNVTSDAVLLGLRGEKDKGGGYKIAKGGLFDLVSCPNYFGEVLEWLGWAFMNWSWAGLAFFVYTCANLVPRAQAHHRWYLEKFGEDYPKERKAVIPYLY
ncbi:steroid 5-alpha-reductase DET2 [Impatiens glandulifera]|uniref:steroid 5-alpha-reductase DET2 n=1 Tax=Impatiens glandulifera TaxID=253017 RepID=UPI001FB0531D|nr:steroid 5-alpha-reductase DET2 [Impatiens glandulifera]